MQAESDSIKSTGSPFDETIGDYTKQIENIVVPELFETAYKTKQEVEQLSVS